MIITNLIVFIKNARGREGFKLLNPPGYATVCAGLYYKHNNLHHHRPPPIALDTRSAWPPYNEFRITR